MSGTAVPDIIAELLPGAAVTPQFPLTAWEQAVVVVIFSVLIVYILIWSSSQQKSWQEFMERQNANWQDYLERSDKRVTDKLGEFTVTLTKIADKLDAHDDKVDARISSVERRAFGRRRDDKLPGAPEPTRAVE